MLTKKIYLLFIFVIPFNTFAQSAQDYYKSATLKLVGERYEESIVDYTKAIKMKPDFIDAYFNRGIAYEYLGLEDKAVKDYAKVIKLNPSMSEGYINRALLYKKMGKYQLAVDDLSKAIVLRPDFSFAYLYRAETYYLMDSLDRAILDYEKLLSKLPSYLKAHERITEIYYTQEKYPEALTFASKLCELDSSKAEYFLLRAKIFIALDRNEPACKDIEHAIGMGSKEAKQLFDTHCSAH